MTQLDEQVEGFVTEKTFKSSVFNPKHLTTSLEKGAKLREIEETIGLLNLQKATLLEESLKLKNWKTEAENKITWLLNDEKVTFISVWFQGVTGNCARFKLMIDFDKWAIVVYNTQKETYSIQPL